jgi:hypothetical protein
MYIACLEKRKTGDLLSIPVQVKVNTSYYIITTILKALRMPEVFLEVNSPVDRKNFETMRLPAKQAKVLCNKEIICKGFGMKESTTCGDKLDADSLQIAEVCSICCRFTA